MSWCWLAFVDFDGSLDLLDLDVCFFFQIRKFSAIICSSKPYTPFSFSFSLGTPDMNVITLYGFAELPKCTLVVQYSSFPLLFCFNILHNFIFYITELFLCFFHFYCHYTSHFFISFIAFLISV